MFVDAIAAMLAEDATVPPTGVTQRLRERGLTGMVHHAEIIKCKGDSCRLKHRKAAATSSA